MGSTLVIEKKGVKFLGNNTTIMYLHFEVSSHAKNLVMSNINFMNCTNTAISWKGENGVVDNCKFINIGIDNSLSLAGAGIQALARNLTVTNSNFINNEINSVDGSIGGAGIYCNSTSLTVDNCTFDSNRANYGSHIFLSENSLDIIIENSRFINGAGTDQEGSSIYVESGENVKIINSNFTNNHVSNNRGDGAAVLVSQSIVVFELTGCNFENNSAVNGGAIAFSASPSRVSLSGLKFNNNSASNLGGAIFINDGDVSIQDGIFNNNSAVNGGGIYINAQGVSLVNCNFTSNQATSNGGGLYLTKNAENTNVEVCEFTSNNANQGGGLYSARKVTLKNSTFTSNTATSFGSAIRLYSNEATIVGAYYSEIINCTFKSNNLVAALSIGCQNVSVYDSRFYNNNGNSGGAIQIRTDAINTVLNNITCINNTATNGGALYINAKNVTVVNSYFIGNNATSGNGGAIYISSPDVTIKSSKFSGNNATQFGGAIYIEGNNATVTGCEFKENKAENGSAIYLKNTVTSATITDCTFTNNIAAEHGTVYLKGIFSPLKLSNNVFSENSPVGASENYYDNPVFTNATVIYVSSTGTGSGLTYDDPTTWNDALAHLDNPGKIVLVSDITIATQTFSNKNVTITSYGDVRRKLSSSGKYMFNIPTTKHKLTLQTNNRINYKQPFLET